MLKKIPKKVSRINVCNKGKVVERKLTHWFRGRGYPSARRSEQYAGNSKDGDADIIVEEFPSFHIESKGTKDSSLVRSILEKWYNQVSKDVKSNKIPVIFHVADRVEPVVLVPDFAIKMLSLDSGCTRLITGLSVTPSEHVGRSIITCQGSIIKYVESAFLHASVFPLIGGKLMYICDSEDFLKLMEQYEEKVRMAQAVTGSQGLPLYNIETDCASSAS